MEGDMESDSSGADIPMEVLIEILLYLPVVSLIRFTCVCKSWLNLIRSDPRFAIRHYLTRSTSSSRLMDNVDLVVNYFGDCGRWTNSIAADQVLKFCMYSLTEKKTFRVEKKFDFGPGLVVGVSNFCHGLMCIYVSPYSGRSGGSRILLCNPAIQEVVSLQVSSNIASRGLIRLGLGFDSMSNDYKFVAVILCESSFTHTSWLVDVYSVRKAQWRSVDVGSLEQFKNVTTGEPVLNGDGRNLNFLGIRNSEPVRIGLLTFDMVEETFHETSMPKCLCPGWRQHNLLPSSRFQACLCCSSFPCSELKKNELYDVMFIWVLNGTKADANAGHEQMWSKQMTIRFPDHDIVSPMNLWMNDNELCVYVKEDENVGELFFYGLRTHELKRTGRRGRLVEPGAYTESLVSIKGLLSTNCEVPPREQVDNQEHGPYFMRELSRRSNVRWSHSFKLI